jgi:hypothetical protein
MRLTPADGDHEFDALPGPHSVEPLRTLMDRQPPRDYMLNGR